MSKNSEMPSPVHLASIDLSLPSSRRHGRAFLSAELLRSISIADLESQLAACFVEEDDEARLALLERVLTTRDLTVLAYPGESSPIEFHIYIQAPQVSEAPIFACVLAPTAVIEHLVAMPPHVVMETATLQVVHDPVTSASMVAAVEEWISRVWPERAIPRLLLSPWPGPLETRETTIELIRHFKGVPLLVETAGAQEEFSPPDGLVAPEFRLSEDAA